MVDSFNAAMFSTRQEDVTLGVGWGWDREVVEP